MGGNLGRDTVPAAVVVADVGVDCPLRVAPRHPLPLDAIGKCDRVAFCGGW